MNITRRPKKHLRGDKIAITFTQASEPDGVWAAGGRTGGGRMSGRAGEWIGGLVEEDDGWWVDGRGATEWVGGRWRADGWMGGCFD